MDPYKRDEVERRFRETGWGRCEVVVSRVRDSRGGGIRGVREQV